MTVIVCPFDSLDQACCAHRPTHIVSLLSPGAPQPALTGSAAQLHLRFNDIAGPQDGLIPPDAAHLRQLIDFLDGWDRRAPVLIHCWAGVSRSTAAGYVAANLRDGPGAEAALARRLRAAAPFATPNRLMVSLADTQLRRGGAMTAAIDDIGRGADAAIGAVFSL